MAESWTIQRADGSDGRLAVAITEPGLRSVWLSLYVRRGRGTCPWGPGVGEQALWAAALARRRPAESSPLERFEQRAGRLVVGVAEEWLAVRLRVPLASAPEAFSALGDLIRNGRRHVLDEGPHPDPDERGRVASALLWGRPCQPPSASRAELVGWWDSLAGSELCCVVQSAVPGDEALHMTQKVLSRIKGSAPPLRQNNIPAGPSFDGDLVSEHRDRLVLAFPVAMDTPLSFVLWHLAALLWAGGRTTGLIARSLGRDLGAVADLDLVPGIHRGQLTLAVVCPSGKAPHALEIVMRELETTARAGIDSDDLAVARNRLISRFHLAEDNPSFRVDLVEKTETLFRRVLTARWLEACVADVSSSLLAARVGRLLAGPRALAARVNAKQAGSLPVLESIWATATGVAPRLG